MNERAEIAGAVTVLMICVSALVGVLAVNHYGLGTRCPVVFKGHNETDKNLGAVSLSYGYVCAENGTTLEACQQDLRAILDAVDEVRKP